MSKISIIDYGAGNIASVANMVRYVGGESEIVNNPAMLEESQKILLPGVGSFDHGMSAIESNGWKLSLEKAALQRRVPLLGICLGMQLLCKGSEEGTLPGLGWIDASVRKFRFNGEQSSLKVPHMGWNRVCKRREDPLLAERDADLERFYFVHSYYVDCNNYQDVILTCNYGRSFVAGFNHQNIWGVQFHPEKSHRFGMTLFKHFLEI